MNFISNWKSWSFAVTFFQWILWNLSYGLRGRDLLEEMRSKENIFVPCLPEDSVFVKGFCVICSRPLRYPNSQTCNSFVSSYLDNTSTKKSFASELSKSSNKYDKRDTGYPLQRVSTDKSGCVEGFACLRTECEIEKLRILTAAAYLNKRTLRVVTIERLPFVKIIEGKYSGVCFELVQAIQLKYNFSTNVFLPYDGNWGAKMNNGTWNGMVGQVLRKEADIGVAGFSVTLERARVISFTSSYHQEPSGILIPPPSEGEKLSVLIRPLSPQVWVALLTTVVILAPTLYLMHVASLRLSGDPRVKVKGFFQLLGDLLHFMIGSLLQESVISPVDKTTRFLVILWWLLTFILSNIYVAYLVSYLSAPKLFNVVNSLEDLVKQNSIKWTFRLNTAHQSLFKSDSSTGVYKTIGDGVHLEDLVQSDIQGVQRVLSGTSAFIKEKSYLDVAIGHDFMDTQQCRMTVAKETFFKVETALIVQKESKFLDLINMEIIRAVSTGLMEKWKMIHWPQDLWCNDAATYISNTRPKTRKLQLDDLQGAFFLWTSGTIASIIAFAAERTLCYVNRIYFTGKKSRVTGNHKKGILVNGNDERGGGSNSKVKSHKTKLSNPIIYVKHGQPKTSQFYYSSYWNYIK